LIRTKRPYALAHWIVELATIANAACGLIAAFFLVKFVMAWSGPSIYSLGYLRLVWLFMIFGGAFDFFDGLVSRRMGVSTELGKELDSQCDGVTFGVIPAMIIGFLGSLGANLYWQVFSWGSAIAYLGAALFRLARFDATTLPGERHHLRFSGMPTPTAGAVVGAVILLYASLQDQSILFVRGLWNIFSESAVAQFSSHLFVALPFLGFLTAWMMVSDYEFFHLYFTVKFFMDRKLFGRVVYIVILILLAVLLRELTFFVILLIFILLAFRVHFRRRMAGGR